METSRRITNLMLEMIIILLYCFAGFMFFVGFNILGFITVGEFRTETVLMGVFLIPWFTIVIMILDIRLRRGIWL